MKKKCCICTSPQQNCTKCKCAISGKPCINCAKGDDCRNRKLYKYNTSKSEPKCDPSEPKSSDPDETRLSGNKTGNENYIPEDCDDEYFSKVKLMIRMPKVKNHMRKIKMKS